MQVLAQRVEQRGAWIKRQRVLGSVNPQRHVHEGGSRIGASCWRHVSTFSSIGQCSRYEWYRRTYTARDRAQLEQFASSSIKACHRQLLKSCATVRRLMTYASQKHLLQSAPRRTHSASRRRRA